MFAFHRALQLGAVGAASDGWRNQDEPGLNVSEGLSTWAFKCGIVSGFT